MSVITINKLLFNEIQFVEDPQIFDPEVNNVGMDIEQYIELIDTMAIKYANIDTKYGINDEDFINFLKEKDQIQEICRIRIDGLLAHCLRKYLNGEDSLVKKANLVEYDEDNYYYFPTGGETDRMSIADIYLLNGSGDMTEANEFLKWINA